MPLQSHVICHFLDHHQQLFWRRLRLLLNIIPPFFLLIPFLPFLHVNQVSTLLLLFSLYNAEDRRENEYNFFMSFAFTEIPRVIFQGQSFFSFSVHFAYFWSKKTKSKFCRGNPIIGSYSTVLYAYMVCLERCKGFSLLLEFLPLILEIERFWIVVLKDFQRKKAYMYIARMYFCIF